MTTTTQSVKIATRDLTLTDLVFNYKSAPVGKTCKIIHADCLEWFQRIPEASISGVVTDPPYGMKEYDYGQLHRLHNGNRGGVWRIPPSFDGNERSPLPRFTALNERERTSIVEFFSEWSRLIVRILKPGAHVVIASNAFIAPITWQALLSGGLEWRGELIRLVRTLRGGDRPKNAEKEFPGVCSMARGCYEPWGIFRKPLEQGMRVQDALRIYATGGLRRFPDGKPFLDVIESERTPKKERDIANHPSLKPQSLLRQLVWAVLPLGEGIILDPFAGSGSTIAAASAHGLSAIGVERYADYYALSKIAAPKLAKIQSKQYGHSQSELFR
jgi:site-specific DNA-methyltransferase (adenine-specific)